MTLAAVYSRSEEKAAEFAKKHSCSTFFTDIYKMADSDCFDAVYIASPNVCHYEQSKLFLLKGKNVICEKPATTTKEQMEELLALIGTLPDLQQAILRMKHVEGFEVEEIARLTGSNPVAVRTNLSRARKKVREQFLMKNKIWN